MVWARRQRDFNSQYLSSKRGYLTNYMLPRWPAAPLHMITADAIEAWLEDLDSTPRSTPLSGSSLDKVLHTLRIILKDAKREGLIHENPAYDVDLFDTARGSRKREPFARAEIRKLLPVKLDGAKKVATFVTVLETTYLTLFWERRRFYHAGDRKESA